MENVRGLVNKDGGKIKEEILSQIRSIIDLDKLDKIDNLIESIKTIRKKAYRALDEIETKNSNRAIENALSKFRYETTNDIDEKRKINSEIVRHMEYYFKEM